MARFWRRKDADVTKAAPPAGPTMVPLADVLTAAMSGRQVAGEATPLPRPDEWFTQPFNPGRPLDPASINETRPDTGRAEPRIYQYPVSWNLETTSTRLIPWKTLRSAGDASIVRQCIEARQRALTGLGWDVTISQDAINDLKKDGASTADATAQLRERLAPEIDRLSAFWRKPDPQQGLNFTAWLWQLMEEQLVLDAVAIYPRTTYGGDLIGLRVIDGSTIKPLLDDAGARPEPPYPAYQQILYGFPRGEFVAEVDPDGTVQPGMTADQLIYQRRTVRVWTPYGFSPVERCLADVDLYLKRIGWMRSEYDDGVAPEMVLQMLGASPPQWSATQLKEYERDFNDQLAGQTGQRMRARLLPPGMEPAQLTTVPERYKPEYDLFLIKLVCSHFGVPPSELGFSETQGLGSSGWSEAQESVAYRAGTLPDARWFGALLTEIQRLHLGAPAELEFKFLGLDEEEEETADQLSEQRVRSGRLTINEDRDRLGLPRFDIAEADVPMIITQREVLPLEGAIEGAETARAPKPPPVMMHPGMQPPKPGEKPGEPAPPTGEQEDPPAGADDQEQDAAKAELATFRRWARKNARPSRPFEFETNRALLVKLAPDLADDPRALLKAGGAGPKDGPDWPGWSRDQALAAAYARMIRRALAHAADWTRLAGEWFAARRGEVSPADARAWLDHRGYATALEDALRPLLGDAWTEAWALGELSAAAVVAGTPIDWGAWRPGNPDAARKLIGGRQSLEDLLRRWGVDIKGMSRTRLDRFAQLLAKALRDGDSPGRLARDIRHLLDDPGDAETLAGTEISRAQTAATLDTYRRMDVPAVEWLIAPSDACIECEANADASPLRLGQPWPGGVDGPPQHPNCRCALMPVVSLNE